MNARHLVAMMVLLCFCAYVKPTASLGQSLTDSTVNFYSISAYYDYFYDSLLNLRGIDSMKGTGYTDYLRWKSFYTSRHGVNGDLGSIWDGIREYHDDFHTPEGYSDDSDWRFVGPLGIPLRHDDKPSGATGKGMMLSLWVSGGDHSLIYAGSHHGGLWKTTNGGESWYPLHDHDARIHGVNSIAVDPQDHNTVYITCNNSMGEFSHYSSGLFKSMDGGESFDPLDLPGMNYPTSFWGARLRKIVIHPESPRTLFLTAYRNVFRSLNGGTDWQQVFEKKYFPWEDTISLTFDNHNGLNDYKIAPWDTSLAFLAGSEIFRINNPLSTFDTTNISDSVFLIGLSAGDSMVNHPPRCEISMHANFPGKVWFCYIANYKIEEDTLFKLRIVRFNLMNNSYDIVLDNSNIIGASGNKLEFTVSPSDEDIFYIGGVYLSQFNNGQLVWLMDGKYPADCWLHVDIRDMLIFSDGQGNDTLYTANDAGISWGTVFDTVTAGCDSASWHWRHPFDSFENGLDVTEFYGIGIHPLEPDIVAGGCQDLNDMIYYNGKWINFGTGDGSDLVFDPEDPSIFYFSEWQSSSLYRTNSFGEDYQSICSMASSSIVMPLKLDPLNSSILYAGGNKLLKFTGVNNFYHTPEPIELYDFKYNLTDIEVIRTGANQKRYFISTMRKYGRDAAPPPSSQFDSCLFWSTNGTTYHDISANLDGCRYGFISDIEVNPDNPDQIWVSAACYSKSTQYNQYQDNKVFTLTLPGTNWIDYSQGLPPGLPVYRIKYIPQYDFLLAATDVGVFKRNLQDTIWSQFTNNLPLKIISDLEVNLKNNAVFASTYGRGVWKSPILCSYNSEPWSVRDDITIEKDTILTMGITIIDSVTLTIRNCKVFLPAQAKITVQRGAALVLDGCTLTSACNDLWWGVEVWGDSRSMQMSDLQGKIELKNGAVIEKARKAIFCGKNIEDTYPDWDYTGGIVDASNTIFRNNRLGVMLWPYREVSHSRFSGCQFHTSEKLADGSPPEYFLVMANVHGIQIEDCTFEYLLHGELNYYEHGNGIFSMNSGFEIRPARDGVTGANFINLNYGIMALRTGEVQPVRVERSYFEKNITGIYASGLEMLDILQNEFFALRDTLTSHHFIYGGVYLDNCTGYTVEENYFHRNAINTTSGLDLIGLTVNNSEDSYNEIYKNTFEYLDVGTLAQNHNRGEYIYDGLKILCNEYIQNEYDIAVTGYQACDECGISKAQGLPLNPAGNWFSQLGRNPYSDFNNQAEPVDYYHHKYDIGQDTSLYPWVPRYYSSNILLWNATNVPWDSTSSCPSHLLNFKESEELLSSFLLSYHKVDSLDNQLSILIDGGNTTLLSSGIEYSQPEDAIELRDQLLANSPYLSDTILIQTAGKEDVLPPVMVTEIMVANPQSAKSENILQALENRENPIPGYMMSDILLGADTLGHKEIIEGELAHWKMQKEIAINRLIVLYLNDTAGTRIDSIVDLLQNHQTLNSSYRLALLYLSINDTLSAMNIINRIPETFTLSSSGLSMHQHWSQWYEVMLELQRDSLMLPDLDSGQIERLQDLALNEDLPGCLSRNILHYLSVSETGPYYLLPDDLLKAASDRKVQNKEIFARQMPSVKVYPNPAKNHIIVEYDVLEIEGNATLIIYSNDGREKYRQALDCQKNYNVINTKNWPAGLYFYKLIDQQQSSWSDKFIITE